MQNTVPFQLAPYQVDVEGRVRRVQVTPLGEVAASPSIETIQKTEPFQAMERHWPEGSVVAVQVIPSAETAPAVL